MELSDFITTIGKKLQKVCRAVAARDTDEILEMYPTSIANRVRMDDDVTAGDIQELTDFLSDPNNQRQYQSLQNREKNESEMYNKRKNELALIYLFQSNNIKGKTKAFWQQEYDNKTYADNALQRGVGEDGRIVDYDEFASGINGGRSSSDLYMSDENRKARNKYREEVNLASRKGGKKVRDTLYKSQVQSLGSDGISVTINFTGSKPAKAASSDNLMLKLIEELDGDKSAMIVLMAILVKWRIELDSFIPANKLPKEWKMVNDFISSAEEDAVGNLRRVVYEFGVKNLRSTSKEIQAIQNALLKVTNSKDSKELAEMIANEAINETYGLGKINDILESKRPRKVKTSASMKKLLHKLDDGIEKGRLTLTTSEWCRLLPMLVNDNAERSTSAYSRAFNLAKSHAKGVRQPRDVITSLAHMFSTDPKDAKLNKVVADLVMSPINEAVSTGSFLQMISEAANSDGELMPI
ncbi:hypothetical protein [Vibrio phage Va2]|nr:hypothetical protein [Vibrio phage Va2]